MRVLEKIVKTYGLTIQKCNEISDSLENETDLIFANHSQLELDELGDFVGSHMIRDPRDVIVSGYFYHLWTDEAWAHVAHDEFAGKSYQQHLNSLDQSDHVLQLVADRIRGMTTRQHMILDELFEPLSI